MLPALPEGPADGESDPDGVLEVHGAESVEDLLASASESAAAVGIVVDGNAAATAATDVVPLRDGGVDVSTSASGDGITTSDDVSEASVEGSAANDDRSVACDDGITTTDDVPEASDDEVAAALEAVEVGLSASPPRRALLRVSSFFDGESVEVE